MAGSAFRLRSDPDRFVSLGMVANTRSRRRRGRERIGNVDSQTAASENFMIQCGSTLVRQTEMTSQRGLLSRPGGAQSQNIGQRC